MIQRFQRCWGIQLFRRGNWLVELWFCPRGEVIPPHVHPHIDSKVVFLGWKMSGTIGERSKELGWRDIFRCYVIPRNVAHSAVITGAFGLFLNIEKWMKGRAVTSAALDFERV